MAAADPLFESLQSTQSMMESFDKSLSELCKDNTSESVLDLRKNLMEYYRDLHKALKSTYETLKMKEKNSEAPGTRGKNKETKTLKVAGSSPVISKFIRDLSNVNVRPEIKVLCDKADGCGLRNYIMGNLKEVETLRNELSEALLKVPDAAKLVMNALEGYDFSESGTILGEKKRPPFSPNRKACILLLESLFPVFGDDDSAVVPSDVKDSAREIADTWRKEMKIENVESASWLDIQAFLQLLASFRIAADCEKDELWRLMFTILGRKQAPELCWSLGLSSDVSDVIDKLSKTGRQLEALRFAHEFGMVDKVNPVDLLKSYLGQVEKAAKEILINGHGSKASENESYTKKVTAMQTVLGLIKTYGLQVRVFEDNLQKKLRQMEQEKENRKIKKNNENIKYAQERINRKKHFKSKAEHKEDKKKAAAEKKAQKKEQKMKAAEEEEKNKRHQTFEPGYGLSERENDTSKRAKYASPNERTRAAVGMGNSKFSPYNIDGFQNKSGIIGNDHHTSSFSANNRGLTGLAAGAFTSSPSIAAQINDERRHHEKYPSALGTSNLNPIGSSLYGSSAPAGGFGEIDINHVRAPVYGTGDLAKSSATQSNYNFEGRSQQSYKLDFGEIHNNPVRASADGTGALTNSFATQCHYERRSPELYTSAFGGRSMGRIGSSVYGSNSHTIHSSDVNQGSHERSFGQYSGFAGRNMGPVESAGYGSGVSTVPPSNVSQGHFERRVPVIDRHLFNSGMTSLPPTY